MKDVCFSPVVLFVPVELGQSELLQFDLQLLVFPLQVHDDAVQEVDLVKTRTKQVRNDTLPQHLNRV